MVPINGRSPINLNPFQLAKTMLSKIANDTLNRKQRRPTEASSTKEDVKAKSVETTSMDSDSNVTSTTTTSLTKTLHKVV